MSRIPYLDETDARVSPELLASILARRDGELTELDRLLIHSEPVARGWHAMFGALAGHYTLDIRIREVALVRIGYLTGAKYQLHQHKLIAEQAGFTAEEIAGLASWENSELFDRRERAVLAYTDAMTQSVQVPDGIFSELAHHFEASQIVELTANIAGYNMVARFMEALQLEP